MLQLPEQRASLAVNREQLARTVREVSGSRATRELIAELAASRRECRQKQREIDSLEAENQSLLSSAARSDPDQRQANTSNRDAETCASSGVWSAMAEIYLTVPACGLAISHRTALRPFVHCPGVP